ncbi:transcriptional attenuator, LytR family [Peptoniphilus asaccharolyticus DSM 20463]|uniref:Transcriptional attenuator, LytR family n=1 Tax=Peptoniphilus asaccharolyticus DSM 20463 TaxID=573058 RepID=A0A1W1UVY3_PEPAS|nr:LCP family protein [Peptoniphilus asaccharolyticus]MBL7575232.1 LCP family protein [Peptoniphilus asaccharolyticus]SMB84941.1 transcriptional attenuator, LytR family [Peptoniphilus asaccharolyticus DSM 20463]
MARFFKAFFATLLILIIIFVGSIGYFILKNHIENPSDFFNEVFNDSNKRETFVVMGVDVKDVKNIENGTRSDTMMIVSMNTETGQTDIISVPRDTYAKIEGHGRQKLNHSFNFGGPKLTLQTINDTLGTEIENYVVVDYGFVKKVTDVVDGVEVDVPMDMKYNDEWSDPPLHIDLKKGLQTLNGEEAIQFLRFRKGYANQDLGRVEAQQQFAGAFLAKLKEPKTWLKAPLLLQAYEQYTDTNMPFSTVIKLGKNVGNFKMENIEKHTLPGRAGYKNKISYFFLDEKGTEKLLRELDLKQGE